MSSSYSYKDVVIEGIPYIAVLLMVPCIIVGSYAGLTAVDIWAANHLEASEETDEGSTEEAE